jgi:uncharacterized protein (TIGR00251 family)
MKFLINHKNGIILKLIIKPGSRKNEIIGVFNDRLKIKIKSAPHEGKANKELIKFLAQILEIPKSLITIIKGEFLGEKDVLIESTEINDIFDRVKN